MSKCNCSKAFSVKLCRPQDYKIFKRILDQGNHPAFIGRDTFERNAVQGGALIYEFENEPAACSLIGIHFGSLVALNVSKKHRGHGLGQAIVNFLMPNFARVIEDRISFFEKCGYVKIGDLKNGITLKTQIMVRQNLIGLAGRLQRLRDF